MATPKPEQPCPLDISETSEELKGMGDTGSSTVRLDELRVKWLAHNSKEQSSDAVSPSIEDNNVFRAPKGSQLDPKSSSFSARAWLKALLRLHDSDPDNFIRRSAGVAFRGLNIFGFSDGAFDFQRTVGNVPFALFGLAKKVFGLGSKRKVRILQDFDGLLEAGEMLLVLGPPGSGCSTLLKTIAGEHRGFYVDKNSYVNYQGISQKDMHTLFRGEAIYAAEVDVHFPHLTVGQTLAFAAEARAPRHIPGGVSRAVYVGHMRDAVAAIFGIGHTLDTVVGDDFVKGISGGERKRVTIAEAFLNGSPLQCWANSTRGLDATNALNFCQAVRTAADLTDTTACVAIYQASQSIYNVFDKVTVLYEGQQIYFGPCSEAADYFLGLGFERRARQSTADFLTSMCNPDERMVRTGCEGKVPQTPDDFAILWKKSTACAALLRDIEAYEKRYRVCGEHYGRFLASRQLQKADKQRTSSPYTLSYSQQIMLCVKRGYWRLKGDPSLTIAQLVGNIIFCLVISSVFYDLPSTTGSFYSRGALLFWAILITAFSSSLEILTLYVQRPIVEKHSRYALYSPSAEALASTLTDMPYKIVNTIVFNVILYFMTYLRREPGAFFFFLLLSFFLTVTMSMLFRTIAATSRTIAEALAPSSVLMLSLIIYTGFVIPTPDMLGWSRWINYLDPIAYGFESLMINEFAGQRYSCSSFVPSGGFYDSVSPEQKICSAVGAAPGESFIDGTAYIAKSFSYYPNHKWRNLGVMIGFMVFFTATYLIASDTISTKSKGELLLFLRSHASRVVGQTAAPDIESPTKTRSISVGKKDTTDVSDMVVKHTAFFTWSDICYDIKVKNQKRRILDQVDGFVQPGTLTALMGVSGAGKTSLLNVLSSRVTVGVVTGEALINGQQVDASFQRKTGYAQQQDLHLKTSTVREALRFSALLRQPPQVSRHEKLAYVEEVIKILHMEEYADAIVGIPGEGLNIEQRKRLTIGVELAARPELLLFLDEPTSGLDNQTAWSILDLLERLARNGQAILCTIHQPSVVMFQRFHRLIFLLDGKSLYFGDIGEDSGVLTSYFTRNGASPCPPDANPAEWIIEVTAKSSGSKTDVDWAEVWRVSPERQEVRNRIAKIKEEQAKTASQTSEAPEFAIPFKHQLREVTIRTFQQYWRSPSYIYSRLGLCTLSALFIGFSFSNAANSIQGLQNQLFGIFMMYTIFGQLAQQSMPLFVTQRSLYEARERKSKTCSWKAFMLANILVEICWNSLMAVLMFFCWYYPMGLYRNAVPTDTVHERGILMFLLLLAFLLFCSTFSSMVIAGIATAENGGNGANLLFNLALIFCGVLAGPDSFPRFWIFVYRLSPLTYLVSAMISTAVANTDVVCSSVEFLHFNLPPGETCATYLHAYIKSAGGYLENPLATDKCSYCPLKSTNAFLESVHARYTDRWRNLGILWIYIIFNIVMALFIYWVVRVPKKAKKTKAE